ncbi:unnamed protein product [Coccothraustes coccothraustes]
MVPVPVLSKARLLLKTYRDRRFAPESSRYASSACRSTCVFAESFSISSHKEELCKHRQFGKKLPSTFDEFFEGVCKDTVLDELEGCAEIARVVLLWSSRLNSGRVLRLVEPKKRLLRPLSIVPVPVLSKARLLLKTVRNRPLAPESSRYASSPFLSPCIFAESFSTTSPKEELC